MLPPDPAVAIATTSRVVALASTVASTAVIASMVVASIVAASSSVAPTTVASTTVATTTVAVAVPVWAAVVTKMLRRTCRGRGAAGRMGHEVGPLLLSGARTGTHLDKCVAQGATHGPGLDGALSRVARGIGASLRVHHAATPFSVLHQRSPVWVAVRQVSRVADNQHRMAGACERHIHATMVRQESDAASAAALGRAHAGDDDDVLLTPLESVHGADLYTRPPIRRQGGGKGSARTQALRGSCQGVFDVAHLLHAPQQQQQQQQQQKQKAQAVCLPALVIAPNDHITRTCCAYGAITPTLGTWGVAPADDLCFAITMNRCTASAVTKVASAAFCKDVEPRTRVSRPLRTS